MRPCLPLLALLLLAGPALAQSETETSGRSRLEAAESAFAEGDFERTLTELDEAAAQTTDDAALAAINLLRGRCHAGVGDSERARDAFTAALEYDPEARLDPARVRPAVVEMLEQLRAELQSELNVRTNEAGALVLLDGKTIGVAPLRTSAPIGRHKLTVRSADGMRQAEKKVLVRARRPADVQVALEEAAPVSDDPAAASSSADDFDDDLRPRVDAASMRAETGEELRRTHFMIEVRGGVANPFPQKAIAGEQEAVVPGDLNKDVELGLGFGGRELFASVSGAYDLDKGAFGVTPRVGARVSKLVWLFGLHGSIDLPAVFLDEGFAMGAGASFGLNFAPIDLLEFHVEGAYRYFFQLPRIEDASQAFGAQHWQATGGLRFWL